MKLSDLRTGQTVKARWGRAGREDVAWGPWRTVTLHVQHDRKGRLALLALKDVCWAEYGPQDFSTTSKLFLVEDYYLQIEGVES